MVKTILAGIGSCAVSLIVIFIFSCLTACITIWLDDRNEKRNESDKLIRCKNCKHNANPPEAGNAVCDLFYGMTEQYGFCHKAERRISDESDKS